MSCLSGHVDQSIHVGTASSAARRTIAFTLKATKGSHSKSKTVKLTQLAAPAPTVSAFKASAASFTSSGGHVTLTGTVAHGATCKLSVAPALSGLPKSTACTGSLYSSSVALPADLTPTADSYVFSLTVTGSGGSKTAATHPMVTVQGVSGPQKITTTSASAGPLPADALTGDSEVGDLTSVSCPAAGDCVAVGYYRATTTGSEPVNQEGLVETLSGTTWTPAALPLPTDRNTSERYVAPESVSCWSTGNCVAVGDYYADDGGFEPYVATQTGGGAWTWQTASVQAAAGVTTRVGADLVDVSCGSGGGCAEVGYSQEPGDDKDATIEEPATTGIVDGPWVGLEAELPINATPEENNNLQVTDGLNTVSCVSTTSCSAVGSYTTGSGNQISGAEVGESLSGATWTPTQLSPTGDSGVGDAVACAGSDCVGSGEFNVSSGYIEPEESGEWQTPIAASSTANNGSALEAASCASGTSAASCVLVGELYPQGSSSATDGLIDSGSGTTYTDTSAPLPLTAHANGQVVLSGVSCAAAGSCAAIGYFTATDELNNEADGLIETEATANGVSTWTPTEAPNPSDAYSSGQLKSISCVAGWGCVTVGLYQSTQDNLVPDVVLAPLS